MSEEAPNNVVTLNIFARRADPYVPPEPTTREKIAAKEIDEQSIKILEDLITDFREGKHHGLAIVAGLFDDKGSMIDARTIVSEIACGYPLTYVGAVENLRLLIADMTGGIDGEGGELFEDDEFDEDFSPFDD